MAESIIDGIGSGYAAQVDSTNRLMVRTEGISVGSVSISAGSETWIKNFNELGSSVIVSNLYAGSEVYQGTNPWAGSIVSMPSVSVTAGSEQWIQNFGVLGSDRTISNMVAGSIVYMPSISVGSDSYVTNWNDIGSNRVITNFGDLGSSVVVTNLYTGSKVYQGSFPWVGSILSMPDINVSAGSEQYIMNTIEVSGEIEITNFNDLGSSRVITNWNDIGSSRVITNFGDLGSDRTISNRVAGSIVNIPNITINDPASIGSYTIQNVTNTGSVEIYGDLNFSAGSNQWIQNFNELGSSRVITNLYTGSELYQGERFGVSGIVEVSNTITGSIISMPDVNISIGSESYIPAGSVIVTNTITGSIISIPDTGSETWVMNTVEVSGSVEVSNLYAGSKFYQGDIYGVSGVIDIGNFNELGSSVIVTNFNDIGSSRVITNMVAGSIVYMPDVNVSTGSEQWIKNWDEIGSSVVVTNIYAGSETWVQNTIEVSGEVTVSSGSFHMTNFTDNGYAGSEVYVINSYLGSKFYQGEVYGVSGNVNISNIYTGSSTYTDFTTYTGSIVASSGFGSKALPSIYNKINWISVQGLNAGSTYYFSVNDDDDYSILSSQRKTGNFSFLTPIYVSGTAVFTISGAEVDGDYNFRVIYE